ncbi:galacturonokinase isoform X2 [Nymphaea colorata]|nr:galacturonokinase isoform X2 [Nymphaea colorata]
MHAPGWATCLELVELQKSVAVLANCDHNKVKIVVSPYRICPLGAHIDHQGGTVSAMTINRGVLLGFVPSGNSNVLLQSGQFKGEVRFSVDEIQQPKCSNANDNHGNEKSKCYEECAWGTYARGALYALQRSGRQISQGIIGFICGSGGLDSSGLSSSAAVGIAYLLALETTNNIIVSPVENIEYDRLIENEYLGLENGILDQSAILLSRSGCLTCMNCKTKEYSLTPLPKEEGNPDVKGQTTFKVLLAFSGLRHALPSNPGYNLRVSECREAAKVLLEACGKGKLKPLLCNVGFDEYKIYKDKLSAVLARRAEHYFSENLRVTEGLTAWSAGKLEEFGKLVSESGLSSIKNYECGCEPLIQLYETILRAPGIFGARFSGAGFRGCCLAFVSADHAAEAATFIKHEYRALQPQLASQLSDDTAVLICDVGDGARVIG